MGVNWASDTKLCTASIGNSSSVSSATDQFCKIGSRVVMGALPAQFALPAAVRMATFGGGGASFGYQRREFLVRGRAGQGTSVVESSVLSSETLPLSASFLRQPLKAAAANAPHQVSVAVNSLNAACVGEAGCGFTYNLAMTPVVTSVTPNNGGIGTMLTIAGSNFANIDASVLIGGAPCDVTAKDAAWIKCRVSALTTAGTHSVIVSFDPYGSTASAQAASFTFPLAITKVSPASGSLEGGSRVVVTGYGFAPFGPHNKILVGGQPCVPRTLKNLECRRDAQAMGYALGWNVYSTESRNIGIVIITQRP